MSVFRRWNDGYLVVIGHIGYCVTVYKRHTVVSCMVVSEMDARVRLLSSLKHMRFIILILA